MQSKNKKAPTVAQSVWLGHVREIDCAVCDSPGPQEVHEIKQGSWFTSVGLCPSCHRGPLLGLHGQRRQWAIKKMDELDALDVTIARVFNRLEVA